MSALRPDPELRSRRFTAPLAGALTLLFLLRTFAPPAHLAFAHASELAGHGHAATHQHAPRGSKRHAPTHEEHEHSIEDHAGDLLVDRPPAPPSSDLARFEAGVELEARADRARKLDLAPHPRPRARSPSSHRLRGPPAA